ncbi:unnamed protein product [Paramecium primaurelia]|uniref:Uncharacterized protein n=1 Tax=Paramecium primaurelia TaxID=5886 RepID=A0A8S1MGS4_PARPR|nr:unnamed protein product [Paramecium primaurelia]
MYERVGSRYVIDLKQILYQSRAQVTKVEKSLFLLDNAKYYLSYRKNRLNQLFQQMPFYMKKLLKTDCFQKDNLQIIQEIIYFLLIRKMDLQNPGQKQFAKYITNLNKKIENGKMCEFSKKGEIYVGNVDGTVNIWYARNSNQFVTYKLIIFFFKLMIQTQQNQNGLIQRKQLQLHQKIKELKFGSYHNLERSQNNGKTIKYSLTFKK